MASPRQPVSVVLTAAQLAWLDRFTQDGSLSRSAAIRLVLQQAMEQDTQQGRRRRPVLAAR
jgi:metal-responsive CopG/Arc/MetJ family transcriptional regulator